MHCWLKCIELGTVELVTDSLCLKPLAIVFVQLFEYWLVFLSQKWQVSLDLHSTVVSEVPFSHYLRRNEFYVVDWTPPVFYGNEFYCLILFWTPPPHPCVRRATLKYTRVFLDNELCRWNPPVFLWAMKFIVELHLHFTGRNEFHS